MSRDKRYFLRCVERVRKWTERYTSPWHELHVLIVLYRTSINYDREITDMHYWLCRFYVWAKHLTHLPQIVLDDRLSCQRYSTFPFDFFSPFQILSSRRFVTFFFVLFLLYMYISVFWYSSNFTCYLWFVRNPSIGKLIS